MPLDFDGGPDPKNNNFPGYFGYKVLAVSYGGTLQLFGTKGSVQDPQTPDKSGTSWARLITTLAGNNKETSFIIDRDVNWKKGDEIVITTTDYLPGHSEEVTLAADAVNNNGSSTITTMNAASPIRTMERPITFRHFQRTWAPTKHLSIRARRWGC